MSQQLRRHANVPWTEADVPDQSGRTAVVTGANTGIGYETARVLAARGANVVLACRDDAKARSAAARITGLVPGAAVGPVHLDLASLGSVRAAADQLRARYAGIDLLINNAGVMMPPYGRTADGFELQLGVNHLGHFALTGLLLPSLLPVTGSRVITISSNNHRGERIRFDDLQSERRYRRGTSPLPRICTLSWRSGRLRRMPPWGHWPPCGPPPIRVATAVTTARAAGESSGAIRAW